MTISQRNHVKCALRLKVRNDHHSRLKPRLQKQTNFFFVMFCLANQSKKLKPNRGLSDVTFPALSTSHVVHFVSYMYCDW